LTQRHSEWSEKKEVLDLTLKYMDLIKLENCITNSFFMISVLKFIIKVISNLMKYVGKKYIESLVKNLHYISMYYGLS